MSGERENLELTMVAGVVIEEDFLYIAQYLDKFEEGWDEREYSRLSTCWAADTRTPWMARDIDAKIMSVCVWRNHPDVKRFYVAMSANGEVELIGPGLRPQIREVIPGAGLSKRWSLGHGYMNTIRNIGTSLYACGGARQVYRRDLKGWAPIHGDMLVDDRVNGVVDMNRIRHFHDINGAAENDLYAVDCDPTYFIMMGSFGGKLPLQ